MENIQTVTNDLFDVVNRIKNIDTNYSVIRNITKHRFELWYGNDLKKPEAIFPYKSLDKRAVDYVNRTRIEKIDEIVKKIDKDNEKMKENMIKEVKDNTIDKLKEDIL